MRIDILTLFTDMFPAVLRSSIVGRAIQGGLLHVHLLDIRDFAGNKHAKVDDRPFGGGPGMVMMCQPVYDAVLAAEALDPRPPARILFSPQGSPLSQAVVERLAAQPRLLLIAGHYEGLDERVIQELQPEEISLGDFVLSGGELPALVLIDAVVRLLPGALGHEDSARQDSFSRCGPAGQRLLDCPHFTRPQQWRGRQVPEVLLSGDHQAIAQWRLQQMIQRTSQRRPELLNNPGEP